MNLANKITLVRVILVPVFVVLIMASQIPGLSIFIENGTVSQFVLNWVALGVFILASLTDFLDGFIARKYNMISNFGKFMDPLADKLLVCSALICLLALGRINAFLVLVIIARDFIISGFRLVASDKGVVIAANMWGKVKTTMQMIMIGFMIPDVKAVFPVCVILGWIVMFLTVYSLIDCLIKNRHVLVDEKTE